MEIKHGELQILFKYPYSELILNLQSHGKPCGSRPKKVELTSPKEAFPDIARKHFTNFVCLLCESLLARQLSIKMNPSICITN